MFACVRACFCVCVYVRARARVISHHVERHSKEAKGRGRRGVQEGEGGSNKEAEYGVESVYLCTVQDRELKPYVKN